MAALCSLKTARAAAPVTVLIQHSDQFSPSARQAMEEETDRVVRSAGIRVQFLNLNQGNGRDFQELVVFRFSGQCAMDAPAAKIAPGPYASAVVQDNRVLPFGEVHCNRIREAIRTAMAGRDFQRGDALLGRALGRVVAHELYHILANTVHHGRSGIAKDSLSARQLLAPELDLSHHETGLMRSRMQNAQVQTSATSAAADDEESEELRR